MTHADHPPINWWLLLLLAVLAGVAIGVNGLIGQAPNNQTPVPSSSGEVTQIKVRLELASFTVKHNQRTILPIFVENLGTSDYTITFPSTCTDPVLLIDNQPLATNRVCGQALTTVTLAPYEERYFPIQVQFVEPVKDTNGYDDTFGLEAGQHQITVGWGEVVAEPVSIYVEDEV